MRKIYTRHIDRAFILAAGFGKRLRPHTETRPKPMVEVAGKSLLDRTIDHLLASNITDITVNTHYLANVVHSHMSTRTDAHIHLSHEAEILDTGGGIKNALENFNGEDFFVLSGDGLWSNAPDQNTLNTMAERWNPDIMDILILLQPVESMAHTKGVGDYDLDEQGRAVRALKQDGAYMFTSMRINKTSIFENTPDTPFSYLQLLDRAQEQGKLYGIIHAGDWHHISTPDDLDAVRTLYEQNQEQESREQKQKA